MVTYIVIGFFLIDTRKQSQKVSKKFYDNFYSEGICLELVWQTTKNKVKSQAHLFFIPIYFLKEILLITGKKLFS